MLQDIGALKEGGILQEGEIWQKGGILQDLQDEGSKQSETLQKGGT